MSMFVYFLFVLAEHRVFFSSRKQGAFVTFVTTFQMHIYEHGNATLVAKEASICKCMTTASDDVG